MLWEKSVIDHVISILKKYTKVSDAMKEITKYVKSPSYRGDPISVDSLGHIFKSRGMPSPKYFLKNAKSQEVHVDFKGTNLPQKIACKPQKNTKKEVTEDPNSPVYDFLKKVQHKKYSLTELCNTLDCSPATIERYIERANELGYELKNFDDNVSLNKKELQSNNIPKMINISTESNRIIRFGVISDTHFGSDAARCEEIADFVKKAYVSYGIRTMIHCGDIVTGNSVYKGQIAELSHWGCEKQCQEAAKWLPKLEDLKYYAILGNHDLDFIKSSGINPGFVLNKLREDINILGNIKARFILGDTNLVVEAIHIKSSAYAKSYPLEKHLAKTLSKLDSPDIVLAGHRHISGYFELNHVHCFQVPSFEDANFFVHYNDFIPSVGGLIVELHLNEENQIVQCNPIFVNYHTKNQIKDIVEV